jgi:hypothetical protein
VSLFESGKSKISFVPGVGTVKKLKYPIFYENEMVSYKNLF